VDLPQFHEIFRALLVDKTTSSVELDQLRTEIAALSEVLARAKRLKDKGPEADSKLGSLQACDILSWLQEERDGRSTFL
jgi:hypothetical protein